MSTWLLFSHANNFNIIPLCNLFKNHAIWHILGFSTSWIFVKILKGLQKLLETTTYAAELNLEPMGNGIQILDYLLNYVSTELIYWLISHELDSLQLFFLCRVHWSQERDDHVLKLTSTWHVSQGCPGMPRDAQGCPGILRDTRKYLEMCQRYFNMSCAWAKSTWHISQGCPGMPRDAQGYPGTLWDMSESASKINRDTQGCFRDVQEA